MTSRTRRKHDDEHEPTSNPGEEAPIPDPVATFERVIANEARNPQDPWTDKRAWLQSVTWQRQDGAVLPTLEELPDGRRLKELREAVGLPLEAVAYVLGVAHSTLIAVESGASRLVPEVMEQEKGQIAAARRLYGCIEAWVEFLRPDNNKEES